MVYKGILSILVFSETLPSGVVILPDFLPFPTVMALYTKMVVGLHCQGGVSIVGFKTSLSQNDTGWNLVLMHLFNGNILVLVDILLSCKFLGIQLYGTHQQKNGNCCKISCSHINKGNNKMYLCKN